MPIAFQTFQVIENIAQLVHSAAAEGRLVNAYGFENLLKFSKILRAGKANAAGAQQLQCF